MIMIQDRVAVKGKNKSIQYYYIINQLILK